MDGGTLTEHEQEKPNWEMLQFADKHLSPYRVAVKAKDNTKEIIPKLCPFCHGGDKHDEETFALS